MNMMVQPDGQLPTTPADAQRAIREVVTAMVGDARRAGRQAREQLNVLDGHLELYEIHLGRVIEDFAQRVAVIATMYTDTNKRAVMASQAVFDAPLRPPTMPALPELFAPERDNEPEGGDNGR